MTNDNIYDHTIQQMNERSRKYKYERKLEITRIIERVDRKYKYKIQNTEKVKIMGNTK